MHACYQATGLPIVGMGGVETGAHALELIAAGASAVALGTVLFADPGAPARVRTELDAEAARRGLDDAARRPRHRARRSVLPGPLADLRREPKRSEQVGLKV